MSRRLNDVHLSRPDDDLVDDVVVAAAFGQRDQGQVRDSFAAMVQSS